MSIGGKTENVLMIQHHTQISGAANQATVLMAHLPDHNKIGGHDCLLACWNITNFQSNAYKTAYQILHLFINLLECAATHSKS